MFYAENNSTQYDKKDRKTYINCRLISATMMGPHTDNTTSASENGGQCGSQEVETIPAALSTILEDFALKLRGFPGTSHLFDPTCFPEASYNHRHTAHAPSSLSESALTSENLKETGKYDDAQGCVETGMSIQEVSKGTEDMQLDLQGVADIGIMMLPEKYQVVTSFVLNEVFLSNIVDCLEIGVGIATEWSTQSIALAQIKKNLKDLKRDVKTLLSSQQKSALKRFKDAMVFFEHNDHAKAQAEMEKVVDHAIQAFAQAKDFRDKVECKWLSCWGRVFTISYDEHRKEMRQLANLADEEKRKIAQLLFNDLEEVVMERDEGRGKSKCEQQDLDRLLISVLPLVWSHVKIFRWTKKGDWNKNKDEALKYIPEGEEDASQIPLNVMASIYVWKERSGNSLVGMRHSHFL